MNKIACIIPARGGSKRIPLKNIYLLFEKPLIEYNLDLLEKWRNYRDVSIVVSSDSEEILEIARKNENVIGIKRSKENSGDNVPKIFAVREAFKQLQQLTSVDYDAVIVVQANSPEIKIKDIDKAWTFFKREKLWEVISISNHENGCFIQDAAFRIMTIDALFQNFPSAHMGCFLANYVDINEFKDLDEISTRYNSYDELLEFKYG